MLILLTILLGIGSLILYHIDEFAISTAISFLMTIVCVGCLALTIGDIVNGRTIDEKIAMYTEENTKIENSINIVVENYMKYERDIVVNLKDSDGINLVTTYPELKSDELVEMQIETYQANNEKIKELKESKINIRNAKWWVYFGG